MQWIKSTQRYTFQPTLPVREVTFLPCYYIIFTIISTHTSREGSDEKPNLKVAFHPIFQPTLPVREVTVIIIYHRDKCKYFNPHFPWGKWHTWICIALGFILFQPTLPVREVTHLLCMAQLCFGISTHTSREGSDVCSNCIKWYKKYFNPHFPWGKWQQFCVRNLMREIISTHTSREGSDLIL